MKKKLFYYFFYTGIIAHVIFFLLLAWQPNLFKKALMLPVNNAHNKTVKVDKNKLAESLNKPIEQQISEVFKPWKPLQNQTNKKQTIAINGVEYSSITKALSALKAGDELQFYQGIYAIPFAIDKDDITIVGYGHVVFERVALKGKAFIVSKGQNLTVKNIECRFIKVKDNNGACIRQEGKGLTLEHVYFHRSENGILESSKQPGNIYISDSRFELLGKKGRAHAIYSNTANLFVKNSLFIASKDQGHAIKNRGKETYIANSLITSLSSDDSRLIDISNGGILTIERSFLHQGPLSVNGQAIGYSLEGNKYNTGSILMKNNVILLERIRQNIFLSTGDYNISPQLENNILISKDDLPEHRGNVYFKNRTEAGYADYPYFPKELCKMITPCPLATM